MSTKKRVLFVGENPDNLTGNGNMLSALLGQADYDKYDVCCFLKGKVYPSHIKDPFCPSFHSPYIPCYGDPTDEWGKAQLLDFLSSHHVDILFMVGIDVWVYVDIFRQIDDLRKKKGFKWIVLFPYDLRYIRKDWLTWINYIQFPYVYSEHGYNLLKSEVPKIKYFRPPLLNKHLFIPWPEDKRKEARKLFFSDLPELAILFGFIGNNQMRKNIPNLIKGFSLAAKVIPNIYLYMHTSPTGTYNLGQLCNDYEVEEGRVRYKGENSFLFPEQLATLYQTFDCYLMPSHQEGLSWTVLEAMLCGTPVVASEGTAHKELVGSTGLFDWGIPETSFLPLYTSSGVSFVETKAVSAHSIKLAIFDFVTHGLKDDKWNMASEQNVKKGQEWLSKVGNVNDLLESKEEDIVLRDEILFCQHSSAGDVLMSTQCFKGLKERHPNKKLVYMTQEKYFDILKNNPYVDEVVLWDGKKLRDYSKYTYSPHNDKILRGGWNQLNVKLHEMYWKLCDVEPDDMFIWEDEPEHFIRPEGREGCYIVVQTTGGDPYYRTYKKMSEALEGYEGAIVQIGGKDDLLVDKVLDLRGGLTWNQAAWIMRHAKAAVVIDSFPSHLAGLVGTPAVVLYGPAPARVTQPLAKHSKVINLEPDRLKVCPLTTTCYGTAGRDICISPCINTISPEEVRKALDSLLE